MKESKMSKETIERAIAWKDNQIASKDAPKAPAKPVVSLEPEAVKPSDNESAVRIATKLIKRFEGCSLNVYPDPGSELSIELRKHSVLGKFIAGDLELPPYLAKLSGAPYTQGWGETQCVTKDSKPWTQEEADSKLDIRVREFMQAVLKVSPKLTKQSAEKIAAVTSLAYNLGITQYADSTACKRIAQEDWQGASEAMQWFVKAQGKTLQGLVVRRKVEADLFMSVSA